MAEVDLLVVTYNTADKVERLLDTLHADDNGLWDLHIQDNDSIDSTWEVIKSGKYRLNTQLLSENVGFAKAVNRLSSYGDAPIIGILNGDVWLSSSDVSRIKKSFDEHPEAAIIGPKQRDERGRITHAGIVGTNTAPKHRGWQAHDPEDKFFRDKIECVTVSGSAYFIRRQVWDELTRCPIYQKEEVVQNNSDYMGAFLMTDHYY